MRRVLNLFFTILLSISMVSVDLMAEDGGEQKPYTNKETGRSYKDVNDINAEERSNLKAPLKELFKTTAWNLFLQEFEMLWDVGFCGSGLDLAMGFKATMIEPIGYMEISKKPLWFPFAELDLGGSTIKSCSSRGASEEEAARDECFYQHFIYAPIMGMIFKKNLQFVCFHQGDIALPIISEFDPTHLKDVYSYKMIPHVIAMISPQAIITSVLNCAATMAYSAIKGYATSQSSNNNWTADEWAKQYEDPTQENTKSGNSAEYKRKGLESLSFIRNTMYHNLGCLGLMPIGGYSEGNDPITDGNLLAYGAINKAHAASAIIQIPILRKQTEFGMELLGEAVGMSSSPGSTLCKAKDFALPIESQYVLQRAYPTVGGGSELGESGVTVSTLANLPGGKDSVVQVLWERRDYYAFAYQCTAKKK